VRLRAYVSLSILIIAASGFGGTREVNCRGAQGQPMSRGGCTVIDRTKASVFLMIEPESPPIEDRTLRLFNNHTCDIILQTTGTHTRLLPDGRIQVSQEEEIADNAIVNLLFRANTRDRPWGFEVRWKGGDASSLAILKGGRSVRFIVPSEFVADGRKVVVPFSYSWEPRWTDLVQHWVLSP